MFAPRPRAISVASRVGESATVGVRGASMPTPQPVILI